MAVAVKRLVYKCHSPNITSAQSIIKNLSFLTIKCIINNCQIYIVGSLIPLNKIADVSVSLGGKFISRIDCFFPPHTAHKTQGKNTKTSTQNCGDIATHARRLCFSSNNINVDLLNYSILWRGRRNHPHWLHHWIKLWHKGIHLLAWKIQVDHAQLLSLLIIQGLLSL